MDNRLVCAVALVIGCCVLVAEGLKITSTISVGDLKTPIRRETCGQTKLCGEIPFGCDPQGTSTCLFGSAAAATPVVGSRPNVAFELRGDSEGYIFFVLSPDKNLGGNDEAFVCGHDNNTLRFFTATYNNKTLTVTNKTGAVSNVLASVKANVIQCTFTALGLNATASGGSADTSFYVFGGKGSFVNGTLGDPTFTFSTSSSVDLTSFPPRVPATANTTSVTIPVGPLKTAISRTSCGQKKLCQEVPKQCNPSENGNCLFVSAAPTGSSSNFGFELRGISAGYIALILSTKKNEGGNNQAFICAQQNSIARFLTATLSNGKLSKNNKTGAVSNVLASVNGSVIQCTFTALGLNATATKSADTSFFVSAGNGTFIDGVLGDPTISLRSNSSLDLTNSTSDQTAPGSGTSLHPVSLVLLVLLSALISRLV